MTPAPSSDASAEDDSSPGDSRRDRLATRRRRRVRIGIAVAVGALVCGAAGAYAAVNGDTDRPALAVGSGDPNATTTQPGPPGAVVGTSPIAAVRPVDHAHPLRLWVGGDSLAGSFGPALGDAVGATGVVDAVIDYKVSSGLWSNDIRELGRTRDRADGGRQSRRGRVHHRHQRHVDRQQRRRQRRRCRRLGCRATAPRSTG